MKIRTSDIYYAAYLIDSGLRLEAAYTDGGRSHFEFDSDIPDRHKDEYFSGHARVSALRASWSLRALKAMLHGDLCPDVVHPRTPDLHFAAFLLTSGVEMSGREAVGRRNFFVFKPTSPPASLDDLRKEYLDGSAKVSARDFFGHVRMLKSLINGDLGDGP